MTDITKPWHIGAMNDALFIIDAPPRPDNDYPWHDTPHGPDLVLRAHGLPPADVAAIVEAHNRVAKQLEEAMSVLSGLSSCLGAGLGDDATTPDQFDDRIRWGVDFMIKAERDRAASKPIVA